MLPLAAAGAIGAAKSASGIALKGLQAVSGVSTDQVTEVMMKAIAFVANVVKLAILVAVAIFLYMNPPRVGGPHNFQRKSLGEASEVFRKSVSKFWNFYGARMEEWWSDLVSRASSEPEAKRALADMCDRWKERGKKTVFIPLFLENNNSSSANGRIASDVRTDFYRYPGRTFDKDEDKDIILAAGSAELDVSESDSMTRWPTIGKKTEEGVVVKPELDFQTWFDLDYFDPVQVVDEAGSNAYVKRMRAVERHDLLVVALPEFVQTLYLENSVFRHVPIEDIDVLVAHLESKGLSLTDPANLPEFMVRYGVKKADEACLSYAAGQLRETVRCLEERFVERLHRTVASNTVLAKSIARNADPDDLVDLESMNPGNLADAVLKINADKDTALFHATRGMKYWRDTKAASESIVSSVLSGNVNTLEIKNFVRSSTVLFEKAVTDILSCMRLAESEETTDKNSMSIEYTAWHAAIDRFRAVEDDTYDVTIKQLQNMRETISNSGLKNCNAYRELYSQYANAVKCAVYVETYLDDAKMKWNVRYTNPLAAENFYKTYFNDILQAYWLKYKYKTVPRRDCSDCFEPHQSPLGSIFNVESVAEYSVRYWQLANMLRDTKKKLSSALRNSLQSCEFSAGFVRKILGEEFDGKGFYGGMNNRVWVYKMSHPASTLVWSVQDGDWIDGAGATVSMPFVWENVAHGDEVVVEDCVQGGSVIYSRYSSPLDGLNRFMTADERGNISTENKILINSLNFSGCMHGLSRQPHATGRGDVGEIANMGDATDLDGTLRKDTGRGDLTETDMKEALKGASVELKEGFTTEPKEEDYCYADKTDASATDMSQSGIFQIVDITDPPDRMTLFSKRTVIVISRSARLDDPRYAKKRLLVFGYDSTTEKNVPVLIDDTPQNRGRAMITFETMSLNTTGGAVFGFPDKDGNNAYEFFLDKDAKRKTVDKPKSLKSLWILIGIAIGGALVTALTLGAAGPVVAAGLTKVMITTLVAKTIMYASAAGAIAAGAMEMSDQVRARMMGTAKATGAIIQNVLNGTQKNPFVEDHFRYMMVLEKPGIWPEFSIVPYVAPSKTIGSEAPEAGVNSPPAMIVPRDYQSGASRVIMIQAKDKNKNSVTMLHPPMITEHTKDNFSRVGMPFYMYSPHKRMFLTPPGNGDFHPVWINAGVDSTELPVTIVANTFDVVQADGHSLKLSKKNTKERKQFFRRVYVSEIGADTYKPDLPFKLRLDEENGLFVAADDEGNLALRVSDLASVWTYDGRSLKTYIRYIKPVALEITQDKKLKANSIVDGNRNQNFSLEAAGECSNGFSYTEADVVAGKMPGVACVRPFYVYEMLPTDYTSTQRTAIDGAKK
jgi:hypothetical protein